jgi:predicted nuclease of predicted toxin-antitoxin system
VKLLLDSCMSRKAQQELETAGHDVIWSGAWEHDPGDSEIMAQAYRELRILVTLDKDFGELAVVKGLKHSGIIRLVNLSVKEQAKACLRVLDLYGAELIAGAVVTVEADRVRIRPPELD